MWCGLFTFAARTVMPFLRELFCRRICAYHFMLQQFVSGLSFINDEQKTKRQILFYFNILEERTNHEKRSLNKPNYEFKLCGNFFESHISFSRTRRIKVFKKEASHDGNVFAVHRRPVNKVEIPSIIAGMNNLGPSPLLQE